VRHLPRRRETLGYLEFTGRAPEHVELVRAYMKEQGLFRTDDSPEAEYTDTLELDLGTVEPSLAGPRRPQDRIRCRDVKQSFAQSMRRCGRHPRHPRRRTQRSATGRRRVATSPSHQPATRPAARWTEWTWRSRTAHVVIAAITSCTNTSNPSVMIGAGLVAKKAVELGLEQQPWVKTSLAPGSKVVTDYLNDAGLTPYLEQLGFNLVGYGCTTCIGNSGPLPAPISAAIHDGDLVVASVLSGNRNFEGASTRTCAPTTWHRRRSSSPTPSPAAWTSIRTTSRSAPAATGAASS
jgi:aconitate hydratase